MKKQTILVSLVLVSCGPSQKEIDDQKTKTEITKTFDLINSKLDEVESIQSDIDFNNRMYSIEFEEQYLNASEKLVIKSDAILKEVDSLNKVVDKLSKKLN